MEAPVYVPSVPSHKSGTGTRYFFAFGNVLLYCLRVMFLQTSLISIRPILL